MNVSLVPSVPQAAFCLQRSVRRMGARQPVVRHRQVNVVVVAVWVNVVGPADGQDVILWQGVLREVVMADDSSVSAVSCEVIVCDAGPTWWLVIGDVGCYQGAGVKADVPYRMPVMHLPQLSSHPHLPYTHQSLFSATHNLPVICLHWGDTQVVGIQGHQRWAGSEVKHSDSAS